MGDHKPQPINWQDVAIVAFEGDRPVIISSLEPRVIFDTLLRLVVKEDEFCEHTDFFDGNDQLSEEVQPQISNLDWRLYKTEDAKTIFCSRPANETAKETQDDNQPLPGQKSLFAD